MDENNLYALRIILNKWNIDEYYKIIDQCDNKRQATLILSTIVIYSGEHISKGIDKMISLGADITEECLSAIYYSKYIYNLRRILIAGGRFQIIHYNSLCKLMAVCLKITDTNPKYILLAYQHYFDMMRIIISNLVQQSVENFILPPQNRIIKHYSDRYLDGLGQICIHTNNIYVKIIFRNIYIANVYMGNIPRELSIKIAEYI